MSDDKEQQGKTRSKRVAVEIENRRDRETAKGRSQTWRYLFISAEDATPGRARSKCGLARKSVCQNQL